MSIDAGEAPAATPATVSARESGLLALALGSVVMAIHAMAIPLTIWEYDECFFAMGVEKFV